MADANSPLFRFQLWRASLPPALRVLLTVNLAVFAVAAVAAILAAFGAPFLQEALLWLALPGTPAQALLRPWTPLTYGFVNLVIGGIWALIGFAFAMYWLAWLGREMEESEGPHRLFGLYVGSAVFGAAVALALGAVPSPIPLRPFYEGAWAPVTAVLVATATAHPNRGIGLFLLGVVPMKWIAVAFVVLSLFAPDATLLGAALFGFLFATAHKRGIDLAAWARPLFNRGGRSRKSPPARSPFARPTPAPAGRTLGKKRAAASAPAHGADAPPDIDRILDKILDQGVESLTEEERRILDRASRE